MSHDDLVADLAAHIRANTGCLTWEDMQLGPAGSIRPDVFTIQKSYVHPNPRAFEVKVSRSDFLSDVTSGKWQSYLTVACGVYFAVPEGLVKRSEVPARAGLYVRGEKGWRGVKRATLEPVKLPTDTLLKLLIDGVDRLSRPPHVRLQNEWTVAARLRKDLGEKVAQILSDRGRAERHLVTLREDAENLNKRVEAARAQLNAINAECHENGEWKKWRARVVAACGLSANASNYDIESALADMQYRRDMDPRAERHRKFVAYVIATARSEYPEMFEEVARA